jgi:hypothetical protein
MFSDNISKRGRAAIMTLGGAIVAGFFTQFGGDLFHTIKNTTVNFSIHIQPPSFILSILVLIGAVSGGFLIYDILDLRRKRNNRKTAFRERVRKMEDGEPETESY